MIIKVCVGSSCFIRGAYDVVKELERLLALNRLEAQVKITGSFCMEHCSHGVTVAIDDCVYTGVNKENLGQLFQEEILLRVRRGE
ncbi:MAG: (2Fe-2S) ferredoxin domain-containing protein [Desulfurispora sp.]|uniref:(2Fe-2S) ferredoxin domain-containing protein n=1 Tax=Desulfurispora sp. TaxID=3014275 RepID=UPI00404B6F47